EAVSDKEPPLVSISQKVEEVEDQATTAVIDTAAAARAAAEADAEAQADNETTAGIHTAPPAEARRSEPAGSSGVRSDFGGLLGALEPVAPPPTKVVLDLSGMEGLGDVPDDAREQFADVAQIHELSREDEVTSFALAAVLYGEIDVMATIIDTAAVRLQARSV